MPQHIRFRSDLHRRIEELEGIGPALKIEAAQCFKEFRLDNPVSKEWQNKEIWDYGFRTGFVYLLICCEDQEKTVETDEIAHVVISEAALYFKDFLYGYPISKHWPHEVIWHYAFQTGLAFAILYDKHLEDSVKPIPPKNKKGVSTKKDTQRRFLF